MLSIRMQRTGRKGNAQFRVVVQDSRQTPTSGRVIANLGFYNPHTKESKINTEKADFYLSNGAQPTDRVTQLFKKEGVKIPSWVTSATKKTAAIKNTEKLRKNQPAEEVSEAISEEVDAVEVKEEVIAEASEEATEEAKSEA